MKFKITITLCALVLGLVVFLLSPYFSVQAIIVSGQNAVDRTDIIKQAEINYGSNIFLFNTNAARRRIMENPYIDSVSFVRELPGRLYISVRERRLIAYVEHMPGSFLFIDETGRVLEVRSFFTEPLPVVIGLDIHSFQLGERLDVPNRSVFMIVTQYAQALQRHGIASLVTHIDVTDTFNTRIRFPNFEFNVGDARDADEKVRTIAAVLQSLPEVATYRGFMDLREIASQYFMTIIM